MKAQKTVQTLRRPKGLKEWSAKAIPGILRGSKRGSIRGALGTVARGGGLTDSKEGEREEEQARHHHNVDGEGLPCIAAFAQCH